MGLFDRLFRRTPPTDPPDVAAPAEELPLAVAVCRHGMNVPSDEEIAQVIALAFPEGLPESVVRVGLSQPSWFKKQEFVESAAADVAAALRHKLALSPGPHRHRILERDGAAKILVVEVRSED